MAPRDEDFNLVDNFDWIYERYYRNVYRAVRSVVIDPALSEDLTQDSFVRVYKNRHRYVEKGSMQSYLCTIGVRTALSYLRWHKLQRNLLEKLGLARHQAAVDFETASAVSSALLKLPAEMRAAIVLKHQGGYSYKEIAEMLKIPEGTVASRISRGLEQLRPHLSDEENVPEVG